MKQKKIEAEQEDGENIETDQKKKLAVCWYFKPSQPQRIISGLRETFIKRYIVERTNEAEKDRQNRVRKRKFVGRIYEIKYS